jgi:hypothetical protein
MAVIYMRHPIHGAKIATMELEAEYDEQNGWVRYNPDEVEPEVEIPSFLQATEEPVNELAAPRKGRPRKNKEV